MEKYLLKIIKLADELNDKQDKVYAEICYSGNDKKELEICIRSKSDFSYVEKMKIQLNQGTFIKWENIVRLFDIYVNGGASYE